MNRLQSGNGGNAGITRIYINEQRGNINLKTCRGTGGATSVNGRGGAGEFGVYLFYSILGNVLGVRNDRRKITPGLSRMIILLHNTRPL